MNIAKRYYKIWKQLASCAISSYLSNWIDSFSYLAGKLIRFGFFLLFIISIFNFTDNIAGHGKWEVMLFYLTFNLVEVFGQAFFRGIYDFKFDVRLGNFDFLLSKPINSLFYTFSRRTDILDMAFMVPVIALLIYDIIKLGIFDLATILFYVLFLFNSILIIVGIHIISACVTILAVENDNFIWLYRETMTIGRFPPEIFSSFIQAIFTFILPIIIITAFPVKALLGLLSLKIAILAFIYAILFLSVSLWLWNKCLKKYSSASS